MSPLAFAIGLTLFLIALVAAYQAGEQIGYRRGEVEGGRTGAVHGRRAERADLGITDASYPEIVESMPDGERRPLRPLPPS